MQHHQDEGRRKKFFSPQNSLFNTEETHDDGEKGKSERAREK